MTAVPNAPNLVVRLRRQCVAICDEAADALVEKDRVIRAQRQTIGGANKRIKALEAERKGAT